MEGIFIYLINSDCVSISSLNDLFGYMSDIFSGSNTNTTTSYESDSGVNLSTTSSGTSGSNNPDVNSTSSNTISKNTRIISNSLSRMTDSALRTAAIAGGLKMAQNIPKIAFILSKVAASALIGGGSIALINISGNINITEDLGKIKLWEGIDVQEIINKVFDLGDNDVLNLLDLLNILGNLKLFLLVIVLYYLILINIKNELIEYYIKKIFGESKYVLKYINMLIKFKKIGLILIYILLILLIISQLLFNNYFNFFINNFDEICSYYKKNK